MGGSLEPRSVSSDSSSAFVGSACDEAARGFSGGDRPPLTRGTARIAGNPVLVYVYPKDAALVVPTPTP
jgi:hypothetical protein